jgi:hypothetical protein
MARIDLRHVLGERGRGGEMNRPIRRRLIILFPFLLLALAALAIVLITRGRPPSSSTSIGASEENGANPYAGEMDCIDRLMQRNDLDANEVGPALQNCRGTPADLGAAGAR